MLQVNGTVTVYLTSKDMGLTWSEPATLSFSKGSFLHAFPGVGHGIKIKGSLCFEPTCEGSVGRLILPFVCKTAKRPISFDVVCPGCYSCLLVSDNGGQTWRITASSVQDGTREAGIVQLDSSKFSSSSSVVYASERNMGSTPGFQISWLSLNYSVI